MAGLAPVAMPHSPTTLASLEVRAVADLLSHNITRASALVRTPGQMAEISPGAAEDALRAVAGVSVRCPAGRRDTPAYPGLTGPPGPPDEIVLVTGEDRFPGPGMPSRAPPAHSAVVVFAPAPSTPSSSSPNLQRLGDVAPSARSPRPPPSAPTTRLEQTLRLPLPRLNEHPEMAHRLAVSAKRTRR